MEQTDRQTDGQTYIKPSHGIRLLADDAPASAGVTVRLDGRAPTVLSNGTRRRMPLDRIGVGE